MGPQKKKSFLKLPEYPGGKIALKKYIADNLRYPIEAQKAGVEGIVYLSAEIDDNGNVGEVIVSKGLGYGCDEEAIRVVKLMKFGSVKNRGKRVKTKKNFRIAFKENKPPEKQISFSIKKEVSDSGKNEPPKKYGYTIPLKR